MAQIFSTQFKKETGKTLSEYKIHPLPERIHWDQLLPQHFKQNAYLNERRLATIQVNFGKPAENR